jgi:hypothetical protein
MHLNTVACIEKDSGGEPNLIHKIGSVRSRSGAAGARPGDRLGSGDCSKPGAGLIRWRDRRSPEGESQGGGRTRTGTTRQPRCWSQACRTASTLRNEGEKGRGRGVFVQIGVGESVWQTEGVMLGG